jgi:hypothetical protein
MLWHDVPQISADTDKLSTIILSPSDKSYLTKLILVSPDNTTHFAPHCLYANGAVTPTCDELTTSLRAYYKRPNPSVPNTYGNFSSADDMCMRPGADGCIRCSNADDGGCDCVYDFNLQIDDSGSWALDPKDPTVLVQQSVGLFFNGVTNAAQAPTTILKSSFSASDTALELSGLRGGSLFNVQGLRTLQLTPMAM